MDKCEEFVEENGDRERDILVSTDQENSAHYLVKELVESRIEGKTMVEDSPKKSSGSNGVVERAVQEVEGSIRAGFLALQHRVGRRIDARERLVAFLPEYMVYLMNRLKTGEDGKTVYERVRGKQGSVVGVEFGERYCIRSKRAVDFRKSTRGGNMVYLWG